MRRALFPSEVAASTPIGLSVPRFPAPHTLAAFSIRPRIHIMLSLQQSPLRVGCLRLASMGTRFRLPVAPIYDRPVYACTLHGAGCGGTDQTRTGGLLIPNQARFQLRYGSILAADGGVEPHGFHRALFSRQAPRPLEIICRIGWRFCTLHVQESNLTVWGLEPRCTSKNDRHPILRGIGFSHRAMNL